MNNKAKTEVVKDAEYERQYQALKARGWKLSEGKFRPAK